MRDIAPHADPLEPLVRRYLLSGDEEAMDRLVERTRPKLLAVARHIGAPQDAEDAVQGAYMALLRKRGSDLEAPVMPWLLTTVIRLAYRRKAKHGRQRDLARRLAQPRTPGTVTRREAEQGALDTETETLVRAAVARLPAIYRDAVVLKHLEGLSTRETAALLDVSEAALRTRLHRGARLLKGRMSPALLALLLALPWGATDALRRLVPLTRPLVTRPLPAACLGASLILGSVALFGGFSGGDAGAAAGRPAPIDEAASASRPPTPNTGPARVDTRTAEERPQEGQEPPEAPPPPPLSRPAAAEGLPEGGEQGAAGEQRVPAELRPAPPPVPGMQPIGLGDNPDVPAPPGMVLLEGGHVPIGTSPETLATLLEGRPDTHRKVFAFEAPRHRTFLRPYYIGRYEVTNAQYVLFLRDHAASFTIPRESIHSLESVAAAFVGQSKAQQAHKRQLLWRQLYTANKDAVGDAFGKRMAKLIVRRPDGKPDEWKTAAVLRREPLPVGLTLEFYSIRPPRVWPGTKPPAGLEDHPLRAVSYDDAERFAEWAGMHIPSEQEWEWAARGPEGRVYPWGDEWFKDKSRAIWGGKEVDAHFETATVAVDTRGAPPLKQPVGEPAVGDGRSWCGLHHLCGNVAEWTSSWFRAYPAQEKTHNMMGQWVKVIRGGGAADGVPLVLRSACRNWVGGGPKAPPYPESAFPWVGLRLAAWRVPGRDHVPPLLRRVFRQRRLKPEDVDAERFAAFVTRDWAGPKDTPPQHVYVRGRSRAVVFVPVVSYLRESGMRAMRAGWAAPRKMRNAQGRLRGIGGLAPTWILGALHTDLALYGIDLPAAQSGKKKSTRGRSKPPSTRPGSLAAGTYLLVAWHDRLALTSASLEFRGFLPEPASGEPSLRVESLTGKTLASPTLRPALDAGAGEIDIRIPFGGKTSRDRYVVHVRTRLPFEAGLLEAHAPWLRSR